MKSPDNLHIFQVDTHKKRYLPLLLLADEQENMVDRYLERGTLFVMTDDAGEAVAVAVVTVEDNATVELKNLAVSPRFQRTGCGSRMVDHVCRHYAPTYQTILVGTGDVPSTVGFYEHCGFRRSHRIKDFFLLNYDHPIRENGVLLRDMVYLKRSLQ